MYRMLFCRLETEARAYINSNPCAFRQHESLIIFRESLSWNEYRVVSPIVFH